MRERKWEMEYGRSERKGERVDRSEKERKRRESGERIKREKGKSESSEK